MRIEFIDEMDMPKKSIRFLDEEKPELISPGPTVKGVGEFVGRTINPAIGGIGSAVREQAIHQPVRETEEDIAAKTLRGYLESDKKLDPFKTQLPAPFNVIPPMTAAVRNIPTYDKISEEKETIGGVLREKGVTPTVAAVTGGISSAALPSELIFSYGAAKASEPIAKGVQKSVAQAYKNIKRSKDVGNPNFIYKTIMPFVSKRFAQRIVDFGDGVKRFAEKTAKMSKSAVDTIKKKGVQAIRSSMDKSGNIDNVVQRIVRAKDLLIKNADDAYRGSIDSIDNVVPKKTFSNLKRLLIREGLLDQTGARTVTAERKALIGPQRARLLELYDDIAQHAVSGNQRYATGGYSKYEISRIRDVLSESLRDKPGDRLVMEVMDGLYDDLESYGAKGIQEARKAQRLKFDFLSRYTDKYDDLKPTLTEKRLRNYHKFTKDEIRTLKDVETRLNMQFVDDIENLSTAEELKKLDQFNQEKILSDLEQYVANPKRREFLKDQYSDLFGEKTSNVLFNLLDKHSEALLRGKAVSNIKRRAWQVGVPMAAAAGGSALGIKYFSGRRNDEE